MNSLNGMSARRQAPDGGARRLLSASDFIGRLEIEPNLWTGSEPVSQPQRGVAADGALAMNDLAYAVGRHGDLPRELGRRDSDRGEFVGKHFAGMHGLG